MGVDELRERYDEIKAEIKEAQKSCKTWRDKNRVFAQMMDKYQISETVWAIVRHDL